MREGADWFGPPALGWDGRQKRLEGDSSGARLRGVALWNLIFWRVPGDPVPEGGRRSGGRQRYIRSRRLFGLGATW